MAQSAYRVIIEAQTPLSFSRYKAGGIFQRSLPYVPGSTLRGTVAGDLLRGAMARHLEEDHHGFVEGCDFCRRFLGDEAAVFTNAQPIETLSDDPHVLPATAVSCKNHQGFRTTDSAAHGAFDTLVDRLCWEELEPAGLVYAPTCPVCHGRLDDFSGVYVQQNESYHQRTVSQRLLTRVAINRRRAVAEEGLLYSPWVIEEVTDVGKNGQKEPEYQPTQFVGYVYRADVALRDALEAVTAVGGGASRGLNHVRIQVEDATVEDASAVRRRTEQLNALIAKRWELYQALGGNGRVKTGTYFTLDLQSDAVLRTRDGRPTMVVEPEMLDRATGGRLAVSDVELVCSYATYHYAGGWNSAWKLPKPVDVCAGQGAVYLYRAPDGLNDAQYQALADLQVAGIGERTAEGYGQVRVCDEFHLVLRENAA